MSCPFLFSKLMPDVGPIIARKDPRATSPLFQEMKLTKVDMCANFDFVFSVRKNIGSNLIQFESISYLKALVGLAEKRFSRQLDGGQQSESSKQRKTRHDDAAWAPQNVSTGEWAQCGGKNFL